MGKITFRCTSCNAPIVIDEAHTGKRGRCDECNAVVVVPEHSQIDDLPLPPPIPEMSKSDPYVPSVPYVAPNTNNLARREHPSADAILGIAWFILGVIMILGVMGFVAAISQAESAPQECAVASVFATLFIAGYILCRCLEKFINACIGR